MLFSSSSKQLLQQSLGFRTRTTFVRRSRFSGFPPVALGRRLVARAREMGSKRLFSDSSNWDVPAVVEDERRRKSRAVAAERLDLQGGAGKKGDTLKDKGILESITDEPWRIEGMTVQELRTTLRNIGIPAKGRKMDLVSALRNYVKEMMDGDCSKAKEENHLFGFTSPAGRDHCLDPSSDVNGLPRSKKRTKQVPHGKIDSPLVVQQEVQSIVKSKISRELTLGHEKVMEEVSIEEVGVKLDQDEPWIRLTHKKPQKHWVAYNPRTMRRPPLAENGNCMRLLSWNVNGLRSLLKNPGFCALELAQRENIDVLCIQETKLQEKDIEVMKNLLEGYSNSFWTCSVSKLGYSGTAVISRVKPLLVTYGLGIPDHDSEGRLVTAEFDSFYLLCSYVPNSGDGLKRLPYRISEWDPSLGRYMKELEKSKPVILTGDLNCAHQEIDIYNPAGNKRSAGFTIEERQSFEANFLSKGFVDTFRRQHPHAVGYTYWGYRHGGRKTNKGWRLDYFLVSESIAGDIHDSYILPDVTGSDHCPVGLVLKL
ncbi:hypothetical protein MLD38_033200 [Melastoma candidum]|uniref:Uncharacterized protein n=1 Tax=Melastoma candidum TaxID=119954 RepID=A0ACB9M7A0_9MYRT|nr:hypothetical protein MLD38_033200 [Melastoma candidum]